jgi:CubicO group peptidase (beta-lactamase class C family)
MRWIARIILAAVALLLAAFAWLGIPATAAGMVAKNLCSGVFVAGRTAADVLAADVLPASAVLRLVAVDVDSARKRVTGRMLWSRERSAMLLPGLGCVLDPSPALVESVARAAGEPPPSPPLEPADWRGIDRTALEAAVDAAFGAAGVPDPIGTRAVVILHRGRLVNHRYAAGFDERTPQLGWSMSKTVLGLLVHAKLQEQGLPVTIRALDWVEPARRPAWLAQWEGGKHEDDKREEHKREDDKREDDKRSAMTIQDLLLMRDGLDHQEGYAPWSAVPRMLWGAADVPAYAGSAPAEAAPGARFRYLSATTNILSGMLRAQFGDDAGYWRYPYEMLFEPLGAQSAVMEADASGNFIASSYLWATPLDWARIGEVMRRDGMIGERRVFPAGWQRLAGNPPPIDDDQASGYGAHVWLPGAERGSTCGPQHGLPADTLMMAGHWGQLVAAIPSREAVIVRLGMTMDRSRFSRCDFMRSILAALPAQPGSGTNGR